MAEGRWQGVSKKLDIPPAWNYTGYALITSAWVAPLERGN